jgi:hypothetical protein
VRCICWAPDEGALGGTRARHALSFGQGILDVLDLDLAFLCQVVLVVDVPLGGERLRKVRAVAEVGAAWQSERSVELLLKTRTRGCGRTRAGKTRRPVR